MSGPTIIQALADSKNGRLLVESFEGLNWQTDQDWTVVTGVPASSSDTGFDGLKSFKMDSTYPQIEKLPTGGFELMIGYFRDDASETASTFQPFLLARKTSGAEWGLGVDNAVSTTHYVKQDGGVKSVTTVARTTAWHRFSFERVGSDYILKIDGTDVGVAAATGTASFDRLRVGAANATSTAFGYFDFIQVGIKPYITFRGMEVGQLLTLYDSTGASLGSGTEAGSGVTINVATENQPVDSFITITRVNSGNPLFLSGIFKMFGGDVRTYLTVSFNRRVTAMDPKTHVDRNDQEANAGRNESITFNVRDRVLIVLNDITEQERHQLRKWWTVAQRAFVYSVAIDSDDVYNGELTSAVEPGDTVINVGDAAGAAPGQWFKLRRTDNFKVEEVQIASISGTAITLESQVDYAYRVGDTLRSLRFWPFVITTDKSLGVDLLSLRDKRWGFRNSFKEAL